MAFQYLEKMQFASGDLWRADPVAILASLDRIPYTAIQI